LDIKVLKVLQSYHSKWRLILTSVLERTPCNKRALKLNGVISNCIN